MAESRYGSDIANLAKRLNQTTEREQSEGYGIMKARANLFFDDDSRIEYLASEKFPDDPSASYRYRYKDGDLVYEDYDGQEKPVFAPGEGVGWLESAVAPNIVPFTTLAADIGGGIAGATGGFKTGVELSNAVGHPVAKAAVIALSTGIGGFGGNYLAGGVARAGRLKLIDMFHNLPPEEIYAAHQDLLVSSGFSALPFGAGPVRGVVNKFVGKEDSLRYLMTLRKDNQTIIDEAAQMGVQLTQAEAADIGTRAIGIQYFLSRQPQIESVRKFYNGRAAKTREAVEVLASSFGSIKQQFGDVGQRVAAAGKQAIDELSKRRKARATKLYDGIRNAPEPVLIDTTPIINKIDSKLANSELDPDVVESLTAFKKLLFDKDGSQIQSMMSLHDRRAGSIENLIKENIGTDQGSQLIALREDLTAMFDFADDTYRLARRVYDPTKPALQLTERSAIGKLSRIMTDKQTSRAVLDLFDPNVSIQSLRNAKRILRAVDPETFKDAKKMFITTKLDDLMRQSIDEGLPQFQQFFAKSKVNKMMQEMLEPDEYQSFNRMIEIMGKAMSVPKGGSPTQPLLALEKQLAQDTAGLGYKASEFLLSSIRLPGRIFNGVVGDDLMRNISMKQADSYYKALADALFDPDGAVNIEKAYQYFAPLEFGVKQAGTRAAAEGIDQVTEDPQQYTPTAQQRESIVDQLKRQQEELRNPQSSLDINMFEDMPQSGLEGMASGFDASMSPTILPSASDREIAMRMNAKRSGIGSLV